MITHRRRRLPVRKPMKGYLFCVEPAWEGIRHWLVVARSIEEAWAQQRQMPTFRDEESGELVAVETHLGRVLDDQNWHLFDQLALKGLCTHCTPGAKILWEEVVADFEALKALQLEDARVRGLPPVE